MHIKEAAAKKVVQLFTRIMKKVLAGSQEQIQYDRTRGGAIVSLQARTYRGLSHVVFIPLNPPGEEGTTPRSPSPQTFAT